MFSILYRNLYLFVLLTVMPCQSFAGIIMSREVQLLEVHMGEKAPFSIEISNIENEPARISKIKPSCSCVFVDSFQGDVPAQGNVKITGYIDTSNRLGSIKKNLRVYQSGKLFPTIVTLNLNTIVFPKQHPEIGDRNIFTGTCAVCHIDQGIGKTGEALYRSDCALCHGISLKQTNLNLTHLSNLDLARFSKDLDHPSTSQGKGFSKVLTQEQTESLLNYLGQKSPPLETAFTGQQVYARHCSDCHGLRRGGPIGPPLSQDVLPDFSAQRTRKILLENSPVLSINHQDIVSTSEMELLIQFLHHSSVEE